MAAKGKGKKKGSKRAAKKPTKKVKAAKKPKAKAAKKAAPKRRTGQISASEKATTVSYEVRGLGARSGGQSGDLQGVSEIEGAGSESVEELLEEGNTFEAEVLEGVEHAADLDEQEVHTHEVSEDDVPEEYLDEERPNRK